MLGTQKELVVFCQSNAVRPYTKYNFFRYGLFLANSCMIVNHDYTALTFWTYCVVLQCLLLSCHSNQKAIFCSCACAKQSLLRNSHVFSEIQGHYLKSLATVSQVCAAIVLMAEEKNEGGRLNYDILLLINITIEYVSFLI